MISKEDMVYPHEHQRYLSDEPHFRRVWQFYREHMFKLRFAYLVQEGKVSEQDAAAFRDYVNLNGGASFTTYLYASQGFIEKDGSYESAARVMEALGLGGVEIDRKSAEPYEQQFWEQYDVIFELTEDGLVRELPSFVTDPSNKAKVEALIAGKRAAALGQEATERLAA